MSRQSACNASYPTWYAGDNGFSRIDMMDLAHAPIVALTLLALAEGGTVFDLGCGNGLLVHKINTAFPAIVPHGLDRDPFRIGRARLLNRGFDENFTTGDILTLGSSLGSKHHYDLAIFSPLPFRADLEPNTSLQHGLRDCFSYLLLYAYEIHLSPFSTLNTCLAGTGIRLVSEELGNSKTRVALGVFETV